MKLNFFTTRVVFSMPVTTRTRYRSNIVPLELQHLIIHKYRELNKPLSARKFDILCNVHPSNYDAWKYEFSELLHVAQEQQRNAQSGYTQFNCVVLYIYVKSFPYVYGCEVPESIRCKLYKGYNYYKQFPPTTHDNKILCKLLNTIVREYEKRCKYTHAV